MANPYKATFKDGSGVERLEGSIDFTDPVNQPGGPGQSGAGSPAGAVVPLAVGGVYTDTTTGGKYVAAGLTNADWQSLGGPADPALPGVAIDDVHTKITAPGAANPSLDANGSTGDVLIKTAKANGGITLTSGAAGDLFSVLSVAGVIRTGFFGSSGNVQPVVPLTVPTVQDVIDALVSLNLIVQHD